MPGLEKPGSVAAELLNSLPEVDLDNQDGDSQMFGADAHNPSFKLFSTSYDDPEEAALEAKEAPKYLLAKSFFDTKEFDRCAAVFLTPTIQAGGLAVFDKSKGRTPTSTPSSKAKGKSKQGEPVTLPRLSQKSLFLALYARFIAGEKRKDEESEMVLGPADGGQTINRELPGLARGLESYFRSRDTHDPDIKRSHGWLEYLYGLILAKSKQEDLAQQWLLRSVRLNPYHWGAWLELSQLLSSIDQLTLHMTVVPENIMSLMYNVHASVDLFSTSDAPQTFTTLQHLLAIFPASTFLKTQLALSYYHDKDFDTSASIFQELLVDHPHRLDAMDHYSNILYVMTDRPKLAFLAHLATSVDKFRPETCCVVGNYYSLCSQHEKAVMYFRRALTLDRSFLSAWTLMGHEYVELKNTHAAIESYRRAVDVNRKDYRAWYGLGQAYEVLDMGFYALFYYQRAAGLRPYDAKMWQAVGSCYAKMDRIDQAIKALKRALVASTYFETETASPQASFGASISSATSGNQQQKQQSNKRATGRKLLDPETLFHIATLYERAGDENETARYMELCIAQETGGSAKSVAKAEREIRKRQRREERVKAITEERERRKRQGQRGQSAATDFSIRDDNDNNNNDDDEAGEDEQEGSDLDLGDGDTEIMSSSAASDDDDDDNENNDGDETQQGIDGFGTGTTATTSKARLWLARWSFKIGDLDRSERLAEELCMDGFEVEEAKGLVREVRGRREGGERD